MLPKLPRPTRVEFTSYVDAAGYDFIAGNRPYRPLEGRAGDIQPDRIRGRGGKRKAVRLDDHPAMYGEFASIKSPEELLAFITQYGRLTFAAEGDVVDELLVQAKRMEKRFRPNARVEIDGPLADVKAWLSTDKDLGTVSVSMRPATLLDALWLQLGQVLSGGAKMRQCKHKHCQKYFPVGGDSGKRLTAQFCCEEHKKRHFSLKRSLP
jgi:hypothetical protein